MAENQVTFGDDCYASLGEIGNGNLGAMADLGQRLGTASSNARAYYTGANYASDSGYGANSLDASLCLYLYGRADGFLGDPRPTLNLVQGTLNTFTALATRVDATIALKSVPSADDGPWIVKAPYTLTQDADPATGITPPAISFNINDEIPPEVAEKFPTDKKWRRSTENLVKWQQHNFDYKRRQCGMNDTIRDTVFRNQVYGWPMGYVDWDMFKQVPVLDIHEPSQWFPDPIKPDVDKMNYVRVDIPMDTEEAKRRYPKIAKFIQENGSRALQYETGSQGYSQRYLTNYETPVVTVVHVWLRNQQAPMTLEEALMSGMAAMDDGDPTPPETPSVGDDAPVKRIMHTLTGEDITDSFQPDGSPSPVSKPPKDTTPIPKPDEVKPRNGTLRHPNHPMKYVIRHWIQIRGTVAPGSDEICKWPDIPVFLGRNIPIPGRPWSQPETVRLFSPQIILNNVFTATTDHCAFFRVPTYLTDKGFSAKLDPDLVNGNIRIGKWYTFDNGGDDNFKISDHIYQLQPPALPAALPALMTEVSNKFQLVAGNPGVNQGTPPPGVTAGVAIASLQAESQASPGFKSLYLQVTIKQIAKLCNYALVNWMTIQEMMRINKTLPQEIVEKHVLPYIRQMDWDFEVSLATGAGQIRAQKDAQTREDFEAHIIDKVTARELLDYDAPLIQQREREVQEQDAEQAQKMALQSAPPQAAPAQAPPQAAPSPPNQPLRPAQPAGA